MTPIKKPSPDTGEVSTVKLAKGASLGRHVRINNAMSQSKNSVFFRQSFLFLISILSFLYFLFLLQIYHENRHIRR